MKKKRKSKSFVFYCFLLAMGFYLGSSSYVRGYDRLYFYNSEYDELDENDDLYKTIDFANKSRAISLVDKSVDISGLDYLDNNSIDDFNLRFNQSNKNNNNSLSNADGFDKVGIALTDTFVNVRSAPTTAGKIIGKIFDGGFVTLVSKSKDWMRIKSGNVSGYVKGEFLVVGDDAKALYKDYIKTYATVVSKGQVPIYKDVNVKSNVVAKVVNGDKYEVKKQGKNWQYIKIGNDTKGYIQSKYVKTSTSYATAISLSEEKKLLEAEKKALIRAGVTKDNVSISYTGKVMTLNSEEFAMFVALIYSEAGIEPYNGKVAVGQAVLNRVRSKQYPNTLQGVIYQKSQFGPVKNGMLAKNMSLYKSGKFKAAEHIASIKAAKESLNGADIIGKRCSFNGYNYEKNRGHKNPVHIGNHLFW